MGGATKGERATMKDDTTYTVTISGPGFSVTAEKKESLSGLDDDDILYVLSAAIEMASAQMMDPVAVLAHIVQVNIASDVEKADTWGSTERAAFCRAAVAFCKADIREEAAETPDDRGGV